MKLLAEPMMAKIHIQNTAPGPPVTIAVATPAMFPTPIRAPMLMQNASNDDSFFFPFPSLTPDSASLALRPRCVIWMPFSLMVKTMPRPMRKTNAMRQK